MEIRECFDLEKNKVYELNKYCKCSECSRRLKNRKVVKRFCISTYDKNKIETIKQIAQTWECNKDYNKVVEYRSV